MTSRRRLFRQRRYAFLSLEQALGDDAYPLPDEYVGRRAVEKYKQALSLGILAGAKSTRHCLAHDHDTRCPRTVMVRKMAAA